MAPKIWSVVPQDLKNAISIFFQEKKKYGNGNQTVHVGYANPTCNMLVLYNKHVWYLNKNIFYFVIYMLYNRYIFYIFPH